MNIVQQGIIVLLKSAVTGLHLELPKEFSLEDEEVKKIIKHHHLITLVYAGALNCGIPSDTPFMQSLFVGYYKTMIRSERQMQAVQKVFNAFEEQGIDYFPTKGCNMKKLYPKPELRVMGDADVFIRKEQGKQIEKVVSNLGFSLKYESDNVYDWESETLHLELHKRLISFYNKTYYEDMWSRALCIEGCKYGFSIEDEFIHIFNHFARHYRCGGIGISHILDFYVYRKKFPQMNEKYIYQEMCKLKLQHFYENVMRLLEVWFEEKESDEVVENLTQMIFANGRWGTVTSFGIAKEVTRANKKGKISNVCMSSIVEQLFPQKESISKRKQYKIVDKIPWLLPIIWIYRWFDVLLNRRYNIKIWSRVWKTVKDEAVSDYQTHYKLVGLDHTEE